MAFVGSVQQQQQQQNVPGGAQPAASAQPPDNGGQLQQAPQQPVSFRDAVAATQARDQQRITDLLGNAGGATPPAPDASQASPPQQTGISPAQQTALAGAIGDMSDEQFQEWYKAQPEGALKRAAKNLSEYYTQQIRNQFGDLLQLGDMANADPAVKQKLERIVQDPQAREFILNKAFAIYDPEKYGLQPAAPSTTSAPISEEQIANTVRSTLQEQQQRIAYEADRSRELEALVREVPALNWTDARNGEKAARKVAHIIEIAEKRSDYARNVRTSYRDIAAELDMIGSAQPPQPIPQTTTSQTPPAAQAQAPRNELEARQRMTQVLNQHGDLYALAAALPRR